MIIPGDKKITASADDFGISQKASRNILDLVKKGKIDRVEVMISDNITPDQAKILLNSGVKLDIHFHLLGKKIDRWQTEPRIIETGVIKRVFVFLFSYLFGSGVPQRTRQEWEKQLVKFRWIFGRNPDGASSHEYIHFFGPYLRIILDLCEKYKIPYIRMGKDSCAIKSSKISAILNWLKMKNRSVFKKYSVDSSDIMLSFDWINNPSPEKFLTNFPKNKEIEIVFHPELENEYEYLEKNKI